MYSVTKKQNKKKNTRCIETNYWPALLVNTLQMFNSVSDSFRDVTEFDGGGQCSQNVFSLYEFFLFVHNSDSIVILW